MKMISLSHFSLSTHLLLPLVTKSQVLRDTLFLGISDGLDLAVINLQSPMIRRLNGYIS
jgi:hypothetical protein